MLPVVDPPLSMEDGLKIKGGKIFFGVNHRMEFSTTPSRTKTLIISMEEKIERLRMEVLFTRVGLMDLQLETLYFFSL
jgi:hypothetical protein